MEVVKQAPFRMQPASITLNVGLSQAQQTLEVVWRPTLTLMIGLNCHRSCRSYNEVPFYSQGKCYSLIRKDFHTEQLFSIALQMVLS